MKQEFKITKAPAELINFRKGVQYPLADLKVGEMFEVDIYSSHQRDKIYTYIKRMKIKDKSKMGWVFTVRRLPKSKVAVIRIK